MKRGGFVPEVRRAWRWFSVQGLAFLSVAPVLYESVDFLREFLPETTFHLTLGALGLATLVSRLVKQS